MGASPYLVTVTSMAFSNDNPGNRCVARIRGARTREVTDIGVLACCEDTVALGSPAIEEHGRGR